MSTIFGDAANVTFTNTNIFTFLPVLNPTEPLGGDPLVGVWHTSFTVLGGADGLTLVGGFDQAYPFLIPATVMVNYGSQSLSGGNGQFTVYGDTQSLTLSAVAPNISVPEVTDPTNIQIDLYSVMHHIFTFGEDILNFGNGNKTLYGDTGNLTLSATGGSVSGGADVTAMIYANAFHFGEDTINAGNGANVVYGDTQDIMLSANDGVDDASLTSTSAGQIVANDFTTGKDTITLGNGTNTVYGDSRDITFQGIAGSLYNSQDGITISQDGGGNIQNETMAFEGDTITVGNGSNIVYGDGRDVSFISDGGSAKNDALPLLLDIGSDGANAQEVITNGGTLANTLTMVNDPTTHINDTITLGTGSNIVYGDFRNMTFSAIVSGMAIGSADISFTSSSQLAVILVYNDVNTYTLGNDIITQANSSSGTGGSIVSGDMWDVTETVVAGSASGFAETVARNRFNTVQGGDDSISLGNGHNQIYGDFHDWSIHASAGVNSTGFVLDPTGGNSAGGAQIFSETILGGMDTITAGSGADLIYGDARDVTWYGDGGTTDTGSQQVRIEFNTFQGNIDTIHAGSGNDLVYGDWEDFSFTLQGGTINPETVQAITDHIAEIDNGAGVFAYALARDNSIIGGDDHLFGEMGNDTIYGDGKSVSLSVLGGKSDVSTDQAGAHMINSLIQFGNDEVNGDAGADVLYGDVRDLSFTAVNGTGPGNVSADFSGDVLRPGGVDVRVDNGSTITCGEDTLLGGAGNDYLAGDPINLTGLDNFLTGINTIDWGDDTLTGGTGADQFAFTVADFDSSGHFEWQGDDTITDFNTNDGDKLVLNVDSGVTLEDLNADAVFTHPVVDGTPAPDTVITFNNGSSLTLLDAVVDSFSTTNTVLVHN